MPAELRSRDELDGTEDVHPSDIDCETVLVTLDDPACRTLLEAMATEALTASELIERCDVPRSTAYRKLGQLTEAGLVEEHIRVDPNGKHASEYRRTFDNLTISVNDSNEMSIGFSSTEGSSGAAD